MKRVTSPRTLLSALGVLLLAATSAHAQPKGDDEGADKKDPPAAKEGDDGKDGDSPVANDTPNPDRPDIPKEIDDSVLDRVAKTPGGELTIDLLALELDPQAAQLPRGARLALGRVRPPRDSRQRGLHANARIVVFDLIARLRGSHSTGQPNRGCRARQGLLRVREAPGRGPQWRLSLLSSSISAGASWPRPLRIAGPQRLAEAELDDVAVGVAHAAVVAHGIVFLPRRPGEPTILVGLCRECVHTRP